MLPEVETTRRRTLPAVATSAAQARRLLAEALTEAGHEGWQDDATLALSELVTNALMHAGTEIQLLIKVEPDLLHVEVGDGNRHLPVRRDHALRSGTGRGLHIVEASVDRWGATPVDGGKVVWFELGAGAAGSPTVAPPAETTAAPEHEVRVELLDFPLLMHMAWQEHAAALLREYLLVRIDEDLAILDRHAQASEAMSLLFEQAPLPDVGDDPEAVMAGAVEPRVTLPRLQLSVPAAALAGFETLQRLLEEAKRYDDTETMLVPPTQPEIAEMRQWICGQVRDQAAGAAPAPWRAPVGAARQRPDTPAAAAYRRQIASSGAALLAMDDANIIVAVSPAAASLLGYDDAEQLLGRRLLSIVPPRYRQAHVAGVTLHLTNGREPLLHRRIEVPALRADGTERTLGLLVEPQVLEDERRIFLAELFG